MRIPAKYESESNIEEYHKIVKQYQFEKWSLIREGSYISKADFKNVISETSERYRKIISDKILIAEDALEITATLDSEYHIHQGGIYFGSLTGKIGVEIKLLLAVLNSKLLSKVYEILFGGMHKGGGYLRYRTNFLENLPIPQISKLHEKPFITLVDKILSIKAETPKSDTSQLEKQIDEMVYKLYELTDDEIKIIEGGSHGKQ